MNSQIGAVPGQWYRARSSGETFQVVSLDEEDQSLEVQYEDGALDEMPVEEWVALGVESCEQPENWIGPYDDLEADDIGLPETTTARRAKELPIEQALRIEVEGSPAIDDGAQ
jgi:hypothetical protein